MLALPRGHGLDAAAARHASRRAEASERDLEVLWNVCDAIGGKTLCPFGDAAIAPPQSTLKKFREEYEYHVREKGCWRRNAETFEQAALPAQPARGSDARTRPARASCRDARAARCRSSSIAAVKVLVIFHAVLALFSLMTYSSAGCWPSCSSGWARTARAVRDPAARGGRHQALLQGGAHAGGGRQVAVHRGARRCR